MPVQAILMNGSAATPLPVGQLVRAPLRTGPHAFFTQASARELVSGKESGSGDRYVIRVWVTNG